MKPAHTPAIPSSLLPDERDLAHDPACEHCHRCDKDLRVDTLHLETFVAGVMQRHGATENEAAAVARNLVAADVRGIGSHGVARLGRYVSGIQKGHIIPRAEPTVVETSPAAAWIDARNGLGQPVSERAMDLAIAKAAKVGVGVVTVKHSNHYGIAGYYALRAATRGYIGVSMTNAAPLVVPTGGADMFFGTNPIAFSAPARKHAPYLLDMATSVVPRGKIEIYDRRQDQMPAGWALDENGYDCRNPGHVLKNMIERRGGGILPLGGRGEEFSGYKGYGLAFMVDILCGVLSGAGYGPDVDDVHRPMPPGEKAYPDIGHFFLAIDVGRFIPLGEFEARLDDYIARVTSSRRALDSERIWIHGEKEMEMTACHLRDGVPLSEAIYETLLTIGRKCGEPDLPIKAIDAP